MESSNEITIVFINDNEENTIHINKKDFPQLASALSTFLHVSGVENYVTTEKVK